VYLGYILKSLVPMTFNKN